MIKIGTHKAVFHSDELIAIALIEFTDEVEVTRSRSELVLGECDMLVDVGGEYEPSEGKYDHHQFPVCDPYYGLSSAGLVWKDLRDTFKTMYPKNNLEDLDAFIEAVDARDTHVKYDESNVYEPVFNALSSCNSINPLSKAQEHQFEVAKDLVSNIIHALASEDVEQYESFLSIMEKLADSYEKEKAMVFQERENKMVVLEDVIVSHFFPTWRKISLITGKCFIMPGDEPEQYKVMTDTCNKFIVTTKDEVFTHKNGFISVVAPKNSSTHIGIAMSNGKLYEVSIREVDEAFDTMKGE